ncbi:MAG: addiction module toxin RelE [Nanoarchaeota archaeon]
MYSLEIKEEADKIFKKLSKKNLKQLSIINKKTEEIRKNPNHIYKFLRKPLQSFNRVYIDGSFVLIFKIEHGRKIVVIYYYDHHDNVYKWRPR